MQTSERAQDAGSAAVTLAGLSIVVRAAQRKDAEDVVRVLRASRLAFLPYAPPAHSEIEDMQWARDTLIPSGGVTVAVNDGDIVGVLAVGRRQRCSWIDQLYIHPDFCGRGIGTLLMRNALSSLPKPIRLYTFQENLRAKRFYERFGFRAIKFGDGSHNEEQCPDVLYELREESAAQA